MKVNKKRLIGYFLAAILIFAVLQFAFAAPTENASGGTIQLTAIDADWKWTDDQLTAGKYDKGVRLNYILFVPYATNNYVSVKEGSDTGPEIFPAVSATSASDSRIIYFHGAKKKPVLDYSASSVETGASVIIDLWGEQ